MRIDDPRQGHADRARPPRPGVGVGEVHPGLGHAVALEDLVAGQLAEGGEGLGGERRAARAEQAQAGEIQPLPALPARPQLLDQPHVHGGDAEEERRLAREQLGGGLGRLEAAPQEHGGARGESAMEPHHQAVGVEERQGEQQRVRRLPGPGGEEAGDGGEHVVMGDHRRPCSSPSSPRCRGASRDRRRRRPAARIPRRRRTAFQILGEEQIPDPSISSPGWGVAPAR